MAWQKYPLVFNLHSPLHIGYRKTGNLQQTRKYVPGKVIWAALTARLTRDSANGSNATEYQRIGALLKENFRFGYFYPAIPKKNSSITTPDDVKECFFWEKETEFDFRFLASYASTALNYDCQSTEEGSLHEVEYIAAQTRPLKRDEQPQQVFLIGAIYLKSDAVNIPPLKEWRNAIKKIQLGGEKNAGWGRVELVNELKPTAKEPGVEYNQGDYIKEHVFVSQHNDIADKIQGRVEPFVGWERASAAESKRSWQISTPFVCFAPGSRVTEKIRFKISEYFGILQSD